MTNEEFDRAIEAIRQGEITPREGRVIMAAIVMMRELRKVREDEAWQPTQAQIIEFIDSLDKPFRRILRQAADAVKEERHTLH